MANNYLEYSAFLEIPPAKIEQARAIVAREIAKLEADDEWGYCGTRADVEIEIERRRLRRVQVLRRFSQMSQLARQRDR